MIQHYIILLVIVKRVSTHTRIKTLRYNTSVMGQSFQ